MSFQFVLFKEFTLLKCRPRHRDIFRIYRQRKVQSKDCSFFFTRIFIWRFSQRPTEKIFQRFLIETVLYYRNYTWNVINEYPTNFHEIDYRRKLVYECAVKFDLKKPFWFFLVGFFLSSLQPSFTTFILFMWFEELSNVLSPQRFRFRTNPLDLGLRLKIYFKF